MMIFPIVMRFAPPFELIAERPDRVMSGIIDCRFAVAKLLQRRINLATPQFDLAPLSHPMGRIIHGELSGGGIAFSGTKRSRARERFNGIEFMQRGGLVCHREAPFIHRKFTEKDKKQITTGINKGRSEERRVGKECRL